MPTSDGTPDTSPGLEELMLAVLELPGDPLAADFEKQLRGLVRWLAEDHESSPSRERAYAVLIRLTEVLMRARTRRRPQGNGPGLPGQRPGVARDPGEPPSAPPKTGPAQPSGPGRAATAGDTDTAAGGAQTVPAPSTLAHTRLRSLWQDLAAQPQAGRYCAAYQLPTGPGDIELAEWLWSHLYLVSLRLPASQATLVLDRAGNAVQDLPVRLPPYPLPDDGLAGPEVRDLAQGLAGRPGGFWPGLMATVTRLNWVAWHDGAAQVAYYETYSDGLAPFTGELREKFTKALTDKLGGLSGVPSGSDREMTLLIQLDAALRGVVPIPLPQPGSWWTQALEQCEQALKSHPAGSHRVKILPLNLQSRQQWEKFFGGPDVLVAADDTASGGDSPGTRVWILSYPDMDGNEQQRQGRYIAVR